LGAAVALLLLLGLHLSLEFCIIMTWADETRGRVALLTKRALLACIYCRMVTLQPKTTRVE